MEDWGGIQTIVKQDNLPNRSGLAKGQINGGRTETPKECTTDARQLEIRNSYARDERVLQQS